MKEVIRFVMKSRLLMAVIFIITSPLSIPYVVFGLIAKEKMTTRETIVLFLLLVIYLGSAIVINLAGYPREAVFWWMFGFAAVAGVVKETVEGVRDHGKSKEGDEN